MRYYNNLEEFLDSHPKAERIAAERKWDLWVSMHSEEGDDDERIWVNRDTNFVGDPDSEDEDEFWS